MIASLVVGVIVWGLIFWSSAFHRKKATDTELPRQFGYNMPLELVLTVTPFLIISVLFYFTVVVQEKMLHLASDPEVVVDVTLVPVELEVRLPEGRFQGRHAPATTEPTRPVKRRWSPSPRAKTSVARNSSARSVGSTPRTGPTSTSTRSRRWAPAPRSRYWCCPRASGSSSSWRRRTSFTRSGCRSSCSNAT